MSYQEIEAFSRSTGTVIMHHEARLLRRISEVYVEVVRNRQTTQRTGVKNIVSMNDNEGLKRLFSGRGEREVRKPVKRKTSP